MSAENALDAIRRLKSGEDVIGADGVTRAIGDERELNLVFARLLGTKDGKRALEYLRSITIFNVRGMGVSTQELLHLEGQRFVVGVMERRAELGKQRKPQAKGQPHDGHQRRTRHQPESE